MTDNAIEMLSSDTKQHTMLRHRCCKRAAEHAPNVRLRKHAALENRSVHGVETAACSVCTLTL